MCTSRPSTLKPFPFWGAEVQAQEPLSCCCHQPAFRIKPQLTETGLALEHGDTSYHRGAHHRHHLVLDFTPMRHFFSVILFFFLFSPGLKEEDQL